MKTMVARRGRRQQGGEFLEKGGATRRLGCTYRRHGRWRTTGTGKQIHYAQGLGTRHRTGHGHATACIPGMPSQGCGVSGKNKDEHGSKAGQQRQTRWRLWTVQERTKKSRTRGSWLTHKTSNTLRVYLVPTMAKPSMVTGVRGASETSSTARRPASQASCWGKKRRLGWAAHHRARGRSPWGRKGSWPWRCGAEQAGSVSWFV
jgi:hypothetical protein